MKAKKWMAVLLAAFMMCAAAPETVVALEKDGHTVTLPECPFYESGHAFVGWNTRVAAREPAISRAKPS